MPPFKKAKAVPQVRRRPPPVLRVPDCDDADELHQFVETLQKALAKRPRQLVLRFLGVCRMGSDPALVIHHVLSQRDPAIQVHADAWSPIAGPGVILWLAADTRALRPDAWIWFRGPRGSRPGFDPATPMLRNPDAWKGEDEDEEDEPGFFRRLRMEVRVSAFDQPAVLQIIGRYLPALELANQPIPPSVLREFGLLDDGRLDRALTAAFAAGSKESPTPDASPRETSSSSSAASTAPLPPPERPPASPPRPDFGPG